MKKDTLEDLQIYTETIGNALYSVDVLGRVLEDILRFPVRDIAPNEYATIAKVLNNSIRTAQDYMQKFEKFILALNNKNL